MRIAVDVKGTLEGTKRRQIIVMIYELLKADHEVVVWSMDFSMAATAAENLTIILEELYDYPNKIEAMSKRTKMDTEAEDHFDLAIEDDRGQHWLAAKSFIWVDEIPKDAAGVLSFLLDKVKEIKS